MIAKSTVQVGGHPDYAEKQKPATPLDSALKIMDKTNIFDLDKAAQCFGIEVSKAIHDSLATVPFSEATLRERASTHFLIADLGLSIEEMKEKKPEAFYQYWNGEGEPAARETAKPQWRLVRKTAGAIGPWPTQLASLKFGEAVSSARAAVYDALVLKNLKGFVRTSSFSKRGRDQHLVVGNSEGLIWVYPGFDRNETIPVCIPGNEIGLAVCVEVR